MEFDREHEGRKYALLSPIFEQNATLKSEASTAGVTVTYDRAEHGFRLYQDAVPASVDAGAVFGKYTTDEARKAASTERAEFEANLDKANLQTSAKYEESQLYYPPQQNKERDEFDRLRKESGTVFTYSPRAGAFIHRSGDAEAFARWQTPEMKAQWQAEGQEREKHQTRRIDVAAKAINKLGKVAEGRDFLAAHEHGFMLPTKTRNPELHEKLIASIGQTKSKGVKAVSDEDLSQVYTNTKAALDALARKEYAIKITAAKKRSPELTSEQFQQMDDKQRHAASGYTGLKDEDYSKMVALRNGFFALRNEMISRDLMNTKEAAKEIASKGKTTEAGQSPHEQEQAISRNAAEPQKAASTDEVVSKKDEADKAVTEKATVGAMAAALLNAGMGR